MKEKGVEQYEVMEGLNDSEMFAESLAQLVLGKLENSEAKKATN